MARPPRLLSTTAVAEELGVSRYTVLRWIRQGYLPAETIGHRFWVPRSVLDRFEPPDDTHRDRDPPGNG